jgi:hypothetical protein
MDANNSSFCRLDYSDMDKSACVSQKIKNQIKSINFYGFNFILGQVFIYLKYLKPLERDRGDYRNRLDDSLVSAD